VTSAREPSGEIARPRGSAPSLADQRGLPVAVSYGDRGDQRGAAIRRQRDGVRLGIGLPGRLLGERVAHRHDDHAIAAAIGDVGQPRGGIVGQEARVTADRELARLVAIQQQRAAVCIDHQRALTRGGDARAREVGGRRTRRGHTADASSHRERAGRLEFALVVGGGPRRSTSE